MHQSTCMSARGCVQASWHTHLTYLSQWLLGTGHSGSVTHYLPSNLSYILTMESDTHSTGIYIYIHTRWANLTMKEHQS
jgi:hypothetical protein